MEPEVHYKLRQLAPTFTYSQAREVGVSDRLLYELRDEKSIETIGWGLFRKITVSKRGVDFELLEIAKRAKGATICLASALALLASPIRCPSGTSRYGAIVTGLGWRPRSAGIPLIHRHSTSGGLSVRWRRAST